MTSKYAFHIPFLLVICLILGACTAPVEPAAESAVIESTRPTSTAEATMTPELTTPQPLPSPTAIPFITPTLFPPTPVPQPTKIPQPTAGHSLEAVISDDGHFVTFLSTGKLTNEARGGDLAVFMRDMETGTIELINMNRERQATAHDVYNALMSANGRVFAYFSFDGNIVAGDTVMCGEGQFAISCEDLFVYDRDAGTTEIVTLGRGQGLGADYTMGISADGRYLALGHHNNLLLYDHQTQQSQFVLAGTDGEDPNTYSFAPSLSADGSFIAFVSRASNLVANDTNEEADVFVLDRDTGQIERVSVASDGTEADGESGAMPAHESVNAKVDISADGRFITFPSAASNLGNDPAIQCEDYRGFTRPCYNIYLHDRDTDQTLIISKGGNGDSLDPAISADGQFIVFASVATNLTADELPACETPFVVTCGHIYLFDRQVGALKLVTGGTNGGSWGGDLSGHGRYLTFTSNATNLSLDDTNDSSDIFRYDHETGQIERISTSPER